MVDYFADMTKISERVQGVTKGVVDLGISIIAEEWESYDSAEGHICHVFADSMSSRPLGWSRIGADKMSRLRIYEKNGGNMLDLVRFQQKGRTGKPLEHWRICRFTASRIQR